MVIDHNSIAEHYKIVNVCLVPDQSTAKGREFNQQIIKLSKKLNELKKSRYEVSEHVDNMNSDYSLVHCTVLHIKIPDNNKSIELLKKSLAPILGQSFTADTNGIASQSAKFFVVEHLLAGVTEHQEGDILWVSVKKTRSLLELQHKVANAVQNNPKVSLITKVEEGYQPHFTLWVNEKSAAGITPQQQKLLNEYSIKMMADVPCKLVLSEHTGPIGQMQGF